MTFFSKNSNRIILTLGMAAYLCSAQTAIKITGAVRDSLLNTPIPDAVVYLLKNRIVDTTLTTGNFDLSGNPLPIRQNDKEGIRSKPMQSANGVVRFDVSKRERVTINTYSPQGRLLHSLKVQWETGTHFLPSQAVSGISLLQVIIGATSYTLRSVNTGENSVMTQLQSIELPQVPQLAKCDAAVFNDTIVVHVAGYDERRFAVTKQVVSGLRIKCLKTAVNPMPGDSVVDIDGNVYRTVVIGTQTWMTENLKTTRFNDSVQIPQILDGDAWKKLATPGYCLYDNSVTFGKNYGALYNWYAVDASNVHKLAPKGWHVATEADWSTLETFLGGWNSAGGKLKEAGTAHWNAPNTGATNETKFSALPGGKRYDWFDAINSVTVPGIFLDRGYAGWWWSSTAQACRNLSESEGAIFHSEVSAFFGASVRCVKD
jgi:uncharacterized protein (TIGR02145 family)